MELVPLGLCQRLLCAVANKAATLALGHQLGVIMEQTCGELGEGQLERDKGRDLCDDVVNGRWRFVEYTGGRSLEKMSSLSSVLGLKWPADR